MHPFRDITAEYSYTGNTYILSTIPTEKGSYTVIADSTTIHTFSVDAGMLAMTHSSPKGFQINPLL